MIIIEKIKSKKEFETVTIQISISTFSELKLIEKKLENFSDDALGQYGREFETVIHDIIEEYES